MTFSSEVNWKLIGGSMVSLAAGNYTGKMLIRRCNNVHSNYINARERQNIHKHTHTHTYIHHAHRYP